MAQVTKRFKKVSPYATFIHLRYIAGDQVISKHILWCHCYHFLRHCRCPRRYLPTVGERGIDKRNWPKKIPECKFLLRGSLTNAPTLPHVLLYLTSSLCFLWCSVDVGFFASRRKAISFLNFTAISHLVVFLTVLLPCR